jgi:hypothetical protein
MAPRPGTTKLLSLVDAPKNLRNFNDRLGRFGVAPEHGISSVGHRPHASGIWIGGVFRQTASQEMWMTAKMRNAFVALCTAVLVTFTASSFAPALAAKSNSTKSSVHKKKKVGNSKTRAIQKALNQKGYEVKVDGKMGKPTRAALKKFQKANGLKPTGKADEMTLEKLGFEET